MADVSTATVSLVVNGKADKRVPPETQRRVLAAAAELGYTVDRRAHGLATGKSRLIGFLVPNSIVNPFFSVVHMELLRELGSRYQVLTVATDVGEEVARQNIEQLLAMGIDALVAISVDNAYLRPIESSVPMILVDTDRSGPGIAAINYAVEKGARELASHLTELGHRKIVYVDAEIPSRTFIARRRALFEALSQANAEEPIAVQTAIDMNNSESIVAKDIGNWLELGATAIVCATDLQAYGALAALKAAGVAIPDTMSLASFDDLPFSRVVEPELTSVHIPGDALAKAAAVELRGILADKAARIASIVIDVELRRRRSTGQARIIN